MSGFDVILIVSLAAFAVNGFTKGLITKVLSLAALLGGIIVSAKYGKDVAEFLANLSGFGQTLCGVVGVTAIFVVLFVISGLLSRSFKKISILQIWDKLGGAVFGFLEGALILSLLLLMLGIFDIPAKGPSLDKSFMYNPVKNFAPTLYRSFLSQKSSGQYLDKFFFSSH